MYPSALAALRNKQAEDWEDETGGKYISAVSEYASTCDGCTDLTMHEDMEMDDETRLGYCPKCSSEHFQNKAERNFRYLMQQYD